MRYLIIRSIILSSFISCGKDYTSTKVEYIEHKHVACEIYNLAGLGLSSLPNFDTLSDDRFLGQVNVGEINAESTNTTFKLFENSQYSSIQENFGVVCEAKLKVSIAGNYTFKTISDDGSKLFIDSALVVSNDGSHGMTTKTGNKNLSAGQIVKIRLEYFNGSGAKGLILAYKLPNGSIERIIPSNMFL